MQYKVLDNGPLRTTFQLSYNSWLVGDIKVGAVKTISLDAGSQLNKINVAFTSPSNEPIPVVAGIIMRNGSSVKYLDEQNGQMVYWEPDVVKYGITGVACLFNSPLEKMIEVNGQLLAKTTTNNKHNITYYAGAVWNKAGIITNIKQWLEYLNIFEQQLKNPLIIAK